MSLIYRHVLEAVFENATLSCNTPHHLVVSSVLASATAKPEICLHVYHTVLETMLVQGQCVYTQLTGVCLQVKKQSSTITIERTNVDQVFDHKDLVHHLIQ
jgi:hypothetical protein